MSRVHRGAVAVAVALLLAGTAPPLHAAEAAAAPPAPANGVDPQERLVREGAGLPVRAVGLVRRMLGAGSGALVGRCIVLTSEHVVSRDGGIDAAVGDAATFYAGTGSVEGAFAEWVRAEIVALGRRHVTGAYGDDWAILRLDRPFGDRYGTLTVGVADVAALKARPLWSLGFPSDGRPDAAGYRALGSHRNCRAIAAEGNAWVTSCAAVPGQSGGPVLMPDGAGRGVVVGIMTATRRPPALGTREAASGARIPLSVVTAAGAFIAPLREALAVPCPDEPPPRR